MCAVVFVVTLAGGAAAQPAADLSRPSGRGDVGFWLSIAAGDNTVFDGQTIALIAPRARFVLLNAPLDGPAPQYTYDAIVRRLHEARPGLPVLMYTWANRWRDSSRIGSSTLSGYDKLGPLLFRDAKGEAVQKKGSGHLLGDVRQKAYRDWHVERVAEMIGRTRTDGVGLDEAFRTLPRFNCGRRMTQLCTDSSRGMDALFSGLKTRIGSKLLFYNGLWSNDEERLRDQERLLAFADGAAVEHFGAPHAGGAAGDFRKSVQPFFKVLRAHPTKMLSVFGRGALAYADYEHDYLWQRYLYAAYLMAAGNNTSFKYNSSFQNPPHKGRTGGFDVFADWDIPLGEPQGPYQERAGVYVRRFARALVLMAPHGGEPAAYTVAQPMFTPEGAQVQGEVRLQPGQGLLLLEKAPVPHRPIVTTFAGHRAAASWRWAQVVDADGQRVLRLERPETGAEWEHDLMLDFVRTLVPQHTVRARIRSRDSGAALLFVAEVDDKEKKDTYAVVAVQADGKGAGGRVPAIPFRLAGKDKWPAVTGGRPAWGDGAWQDIALDGKEIFGRSGRYIFRRWSHVRLIGAMDVDKVSIEPRANQS